MEYRHEYKLGSASIMLLYSLNCIQNLCIWIGEKLKYWKISHFGKWKYINMLSTFMYSLWFCVIPANITAFMLALVKIIKRPQYMISSPLCIYVLSLSKENILEQTVYNFTWVVQGTVYQSCWLYFVCFNLHLWILYVKKDRQ